MVSEPSTRDRARSRRKTGLSFRVLFDHSFRVFFLLGGAYGSALLAVWVAVLAGWMGAPLWLMPIWWHAHEMIFGFVTAAIAGFLLTAVPTWTGTERVSGAPLALLASLWVAGRLAMLLAGHLPPWSVALLDSLFLPGVVLAIGPPIFSSGRARNYGIPPLLLALMACNVAIHVQATSPTHHAADVGLRLAVYLVVVLISVVGGRIVPAFTANALRREGNRAVVRVRPWLAPPTVAALLLFAALDVVAHGTPWAGAAALLASGLLLARLSGWQAHQTLGNPLLWSLHLGYAWLPLGLLLLGLSALGLGPSRSLGLHALTAGGIGTMVLAVMSRVALGHTGRPLAAPRVIAVAYLVLAAGAALRVVGPSVWPESSPTLLHVAGLLWSGSFAVFTVVYAPILLSPSLDTEV